MKNKVLKRKFSLKFEILESSRKFRNFGIKYEVLIEFYSYFFPFQVCGILGLILYIFPISGGYPWFPLATSLVTTYFLLIGWLSTINVIISTNFNVKWLNSCVYFYGILVLLVFCLIVMFLIVAPLGKFFSNLRLLFFSGG